MQKNLIYFILLFQAIASVSIIGIFDGTYDAGDSIMHYLFAYYAPKHPALYFDHWAKPVFVLLASPFAQMGFTGIKIFNLIISLFNTYFTCQTAKELKLQNAWVAGIIMVFAPLNFILTFTGFTEPLFALFIVLGILQSCKGKIFQAAVIISFLPHVRSEGLIIIGIFFLYFVYKKNWRALPLLFTGSVLYAIAGYFVYHDLLWVFTRIPYATLNSVYGKGTLTHFAEQWLYVVGVPLYALFCIGFLFMAFRAVKKNIKAEEFILIFLGFGAFFTAHTLFWYLGIFNSFGLKRVLIGIMPLGAIIILYGFNFATEQVWKRDSALKNIFKYALLLYIVVFPVTPNPAAIEWKDDFCLGSDQRAMNEMAKRIMNQQKIQLPLIYNHQSISMAFNNDYFSAHEHISLDARALENLKSGDILIWDNSGFERDKISLESLKARQDLRVIDELTVNEKGNEVIFVALRKN